MSVILTILLTTGTLYAQMVLQKQCSAKGENYIFSAQECIQYVVYEGDEEGALNIVVHGTWDEGTNTLGRYAPYAETLSLTTDITTVAVALPGYSGSSTNIFKALSHKGSIHLSAQKEYLDFVAKLIMALKTKYKAKTVNYIGHSAGGMIGSTLAGLHPDVINNVISIGGRYNIHEVSDKPSLISIVDVIEQVKKDTRLLLIYGSADKISPPVVTTSFYSQALNKGLNVKLVEVKDGVHLDLDMTDTAVEAIAEFLEGE